MQRELDRANYVHSESILLLQEFLGMVHLDLEILRRNVVAQLQILFCELLGLQLEDVADEFESELV